MIKINISQSIKNLQKIEIVKEVADAVVLKNLPVVNRVSSEQAKIGITQKHLNVVINLILVEKVQAALAKENHSTAIVPPVEKVGKKEANVNHLTEVFLDVMAKARAKENHSTAIVPPVEKVGKKEANVNHLTEVFLDVMAKARAKENHSTAAPQREERGERNHLTKFPRRAQAKENHSTAIVLPVEKVVRKEGNVNHLTEVFLDVMAKAQAKENHSTAIVPP
ncbi:MAG: hypothetical protein IPL26_12135 [Leptospiraceae bacterium]|nr:hypothetical protein [Leptospiraceae bacterium]